MRNPETMIRAADVVIGKNKTEILALATAFRQAPYEEKMLYDYCYGEHLEMHAAELEELENMHIIQKLGTPELVNDGVLIPVETARALLKNTRLQVKDISGGASHGYDYAVMLRGTNTWLMRSSDERIDGKYAARFSLSQIESLLPMVNAIAKQMEPFVRRTA